MIQSFGDPALDEFFNGVSTARSRNLVPSDLQERVRDKLEWLNAAASLEDLRVPPANRLEALQGDLAGYHSVRVNAKWRLVFRWTDAGPASVLFLDYH